MQKEIWYSRCGKKSKASTFQSSVTGEVVPLQVDIRCSRVLILLGYSIPCSAECKANELWYSYWQLLVLLHLKRYQLKCDTEHSPSQAPWELNGWQQFPRILYSGFAPNYIKTKTLQIILEGKFHVSFDYVFIVRTYFYINQSRLKNWSKGSLQN